MDKVMSSVETPEPKLRPSRYQASPTVRSPHRGPDSITLSFNTVSKDTVMISAPDLPEGSLLTVQMSPWVGRVPWRIVHGPSTRASFPLSGLDPGRSYFLRARCGTGKWSAVQPLRTEGLGGGDGGGVGGGLSDELSLLNPTCPVFHGARAALVVCVRKGASPVGVAHSQHHRMQQQQMPGGDGPVTREVEVRVDACAQLAATLRKQLGFGCVVELVDPTLAELRQAVTALGGAHAAHKGSFGLFAFSGPGVLYGGDVYCLPADARVFAPSEAPFEGVPLSSVANYFGAAKGSGFMMACELSGHDGTGAPLGAPEDASESAREAVAKPVPGVEDEAAATSLNWGVRTPHIRYQGAQMIGSVSGPLIPSLRAALQSPRLTLTEIYTRTRTAYEKKAPTAGGTFWSNCDTKIRLL